MAKWNLSLTASTNKLEEGLRKAESAMKKTARSMSRVGKSLARNVTLPLAIAGAAGVKLSVDLQDSFLKIENLVGITGKTLEQFKKRVSGLSSVVGKSQRELADALFVITSAGQRGGEALDILERSAKASAIGLGETKDIARAVTSAINAYGKENLSAAKATDTLTAIVREGNLEASELAPTLGRVIGIASQVGVSFTQLGANIAAFTRLGVDSNEAVTALRGVLNAVIKPSKDAEEAFASFGTSADEVRQSIRENGLAQTLMDLMEATGGNVEVLSKIIPNVRAFANVLGTAGAQGEEYLAIVENIETANGIVDEGFEKVSESAGFKFKQALVSLQNVGIQIGDILLPTLASVADLFGRVFKKINQVNPAFLKIAVSMGVVAAAIGPALIGLSSMIKAWQGIKLAMSAISVTSLLNPMTLAIVAIAAASILTLVYWEDIAKWVNETYKQSLNWRIAIESVITVFKVMWDIIKGIGRNIIALLSFDVNKIKEAWKQGWEDVIVSVSEGVSNVWKNSGERLGESLGDGALKTAAEKLEELKNLMNNITPEVDSGGGGTKKRDTPTAVNPLSTLGDIEGVEKLTTSLNDLDEKQRSVAESVQLIKNNYEGAMGPIAEKAEAFGERMSAVAKVVANGLESMVEDALMAMGAAFGAGENVLKAIGSSILGSLISIMERVGKIAISIGGVIEALNAALKTLRPGIAIAAGIALLVLAGALKGVMSKKSKSPTPMADGGLLYGPTEVLAGEYPGAKQNPEVFAPLDKLKGMLGGNQAGNLTGSFKLTGDDMVLWVERNASKMQSSSGRSIFIGE